MIVRLVHQEGDGSATWTVTASYDDAADKVFTILPAQAVDVVFDCDGIVIEKDAVEQTLTLTETTEWTLYLRGSVDAFPKVHYMDSTVFGLFVFFWAWLVLRLAPK